MTYQVIVSKIGKIVNTIDGIEAANALEAINRIELNYGKPQEAGTLTDTNGCSQEARWNGYEYNARQRGMTLP